MGSTFNSGEIGISALVTFNIIIVHSRWGFCASKIIWWCFDLSLCSSLVTSSNATKTWKSLNLCGLSDIVLVLKFVVDFIENLPVLVFLLIDLVS